MELGTEGSSLDFITVTDEPSKDFLAKAWVDLFEPELLEISVVAVHSQR